MPPHVDPTGANECRCPAPEEVYSEDECRLPEAAPICSEPESEGDWSKVGDLVASLWAPVRDFFVSVAAASLLPSKAESRGSPLAAPARVGNDQRLSSADVRRLMNYARSCGRNKIKELTTGPTAEFPQASAAKRVRAFQDSPATVDPGINYYVNRALDFAYRNPEGLLPDYYLDYGDKYAKRFAFETAPTLSGEGPEWLQRTLLALQRIMNDRIGSDPAAFARLERDNEAFREYAYDTHPQAYLEDGRLCHMAGQWEISNIWHIVTTPDGGDFWDGLPQVIEVLPPLMAAAVWPDD